MAITVHISTVDLIASGLHVGDEVILTNAPDTLFSDQETLDLNLGVNPNNYQGKFYVTSIVDATHFIYDGFLNGVQANLTINGGTVAYSFVHNLTKDEQIDAIVAYASTLKDKRQTLVWPPAAKVKNDDGTITVVEGSFLAACLASAKSAYPAQQGFTNLLIPGPYELLYSNTYFTKAQLKRLVDAGVFVFVQDTPGAKIYALRQVTTDMSTFENSELSCVTAIDKVSADLVSIFKPYVGPYNINSDYLAFLNSIGSAYMYQAKSQKAPMCGSLILNGTIDSILANVNGSNPEIPDGTVEVTASIEIGKPANWIQIKLLVS